VEAESQQAAQVWLPEGLPFHSSASLPGPPANWARLLRAAQRAGVGVEKLEPVMKMGARSFGQVSAQDLIPSHRQVESYPGLLANPAKKYRMALSIHLQVSFRLAFHGPGMEEMRAAVPGCQANRELFQARRVYQTARRQREKTTNPECLFPRAFQKVRPFQKQAVLRVRWGVLFLRQACAGGQTNHQPHLLNLTWPGLDHLPPNAVNLRFRLVPDRHQYGRVHGCAPTIRELRQLFAPETRRPAMIPRFRMKPYSGRGSMLRHVIRAANQANPVPGRQYFGALALHPAEPVG
jgi:hypothetical protein